MLAPPSQDEAIADALVSGLEIACRANHATRTVEPLVAFLQHGPSMNETECLGSLKAIVNNAMAALAMKDVMILEWMRHITRHKLDEKYNTMIQAPMGLTCTMP
jgi:hypothetical protein